MENSVQTSTPPVPFSENCPLRGVFEMLSDRWTLLIIRALCSRRMRNSELMRELDGISQKMLAQTLRAMIRNGLVDRRDHHEVPPRVDYALTPLGMSLKGPVEELGRWAQQHHRDIDAARAAYDAANGVPAPD